MKAMMLAAGLGTRMLPHSKHLPKPAMPFLGLPLGLFPCSLSLQLGVTEFVFNTHHLPEILELNLKPYLDKEGIPCSFVNEKDILGSGGGLQNSKPHFIGEDVFIVFNADEVILPSDLEQIHQFRDEFLASKAIASFYCIEHPEVGKRFGGVWINKNREVLGFGKDPISGSKKALHFTGLSMYRSKIFHYLSDGPSNILYDAVVSALKMGETAEAFLSKSRWFELGNPAEFILAHDEIIKSWDQKDLWPIKYCIDKFANKNLKDQWLSWNAQLPISVGAPEGFAIGKSSWNIFLNSDSSWNTKSLDKCIILGKAESFNESSYRGEILDFPS